MAKLRHVDAICGACTAGVSVVCMSSMAGDATSGALSVFPALLDAVGLGFLSRIPNEVLQPLLVALLTLSVGAAYVAYRGHGRPHALLLAAPSAVVMYASIYVVMSDALYVASLAGLVAASLWGISLARRGTRAA